MTASDPALPAPRAGQAAPGDRPAWHRWAVIAAVHVACIFLWEAAEQPLLFPELVDHLVAEALRDTVKKFDDPVPQGAYLLPR